MADDESVGEITTSGGRGTTVAIVVIIVVIILVVIGLAILFARVDRVPPNEQPLNPAAFAPLQKGAACLTVPSQFCDISAQLICDNGYYGSGPPAPGGGVQALPPGTCLLQLGAPCAADTDCAHNPYVVQPIPPGGSGTTPVLPPGVTTNLSYPLRCLPNAQNTQVCVVPANGPCTINPSPNAAGSPCQSGYSCKPFTGSTPSPTGYACQPNS